METMLIEKEGLTSDKEIRHKIITEGLSYCPSCKRAIKSQVLLKDKFLYLFSFCPFEKEAHEKLLMKYEGNLFSKNWEWGAYKPRHWSVVTKNIQVGDKRESRSDIEEFGIRNFGHVANAILKLTSQCNMRCRFCFDKLDSEKEEMDINSIITILQNHHRSVITLFGGEPTLRGDIDLIIKLIRRSQNLPVLFTNGLKLANVRFLKGLRKAGLRDLCFTIDGFEPSLLKQNRGIPEKIQFIKLEALKNLENEEMRTNLQTTLFKSNYKVQIQQVLDLALKNESIKNIWFRPVFLMGEEELFEINREEIQRAVSEYLEVAPETFQLWDELKVEIAKFFTKNFPWFRLPMFEQDISYLKKEKELFVPLFNTHELKGMIAVLKEKKPSYFLQKKLSSLLLKLMTEIFMLRYPEKVLNKNRIFRIKTQQLGRPGLCLIPKPGMLVSILLYYPGGKIYASPCWDSKIYAQQQTTP